MTYCRAYLSDVIIGISLNLREPENGREVDNEDEYYVDDGF